MLNKNKPVVIVIVGPTASGKTSLGIDIAKEFNGQVISADSMQIYRKLDVGTAKVTEKEREEIEHHLIDICDVEERFSVAEYKRMCYEKIDEILQKNKTPVIVGGTGLYINAVVNNMNFDGSTQENKYRKELEKILEEKGKEYLYNMLLNVDSKAAEKIHINNTKRVIRAIEIAKLGLSKSDIDKRNDLWHKNNSPYRFIIINIDMPREQLYDRINKRVEFMVKNGAIEEARYLKNKPLDSTNTALQAIGYKELFMYIDGKETLDEAVTKLKQNTRHYAKRQITWFKKLDSDIIFDEKITKEELIEILKRKIYG